MENKDKTTLRLEWFDAIVALTALLECIDSITQQLESQEIGDDEAYELDERLNDYRVLVQKLKAKYAEIGEKGELPEALRKRLAKV